MTNIKAMKLAIDALLWANDEINGWLDDAGGWDPEEHPKIFEAIAALRQAISEAEQVEPPPECVTDNEKRAFAYGWFKALEKNI